MIFFKNMTFSQVLMEETFINLIKTVGKKCIFLKSLKKDGDICYTYVLERKINTHISA